MIKGATYGYSYFQTLFVVFCILLLLFDKRTFKRKKKEWNAIVFIFSVVDKADNYENRELKKPKSSN